jgi:hypothetical protein
LCAAVVGELDEVGERVFFEDERELFVVGRPVCYSGRGVEEDLEADLLRLSARVDAGRRAGKEGDLCYCLRRLSEVCAPAGVGFCEEVFDQPEPDVVAHLVELLVDFDIVAFKILAQLRDDGSVCERDELGVL